MSTLGGVGERLGTFLKYNYKDTSDDTAQGKIMPKYS